MTSASRSRAAGRSVSCWWPAPARCTTCGCPPTPTARRSSTRSPTLADDAGARRCGGCPACRSTRRPAPRRRRASSRSRRRSPPSSSTCCSPRPMRSSWRSTASPTRRTWGRCCAPRRRSARPARCCRGTVRSGITPAVTKAAAGAIEHLPLAFVSGIPNALEQVQRAGVWSVGLDAGGTTSVFDVAVADQPIVLVLGAEGRGLSRLARGPCDVVASIPMRGQVESLNVSAAAAIACAAIARARIRYVRAGAWLSAADRAASPIAAQGLGRPRRGGRRDLAHRAACRSRSEGAAARRHQRARSGRSSSCRSAASAPTTGPSPHDDGPERRLYETWAHAASLVPMEHEPLLRWRQAIGGCTTRARRTPRARRHVPRRANRRTSRAWSTRSPSAVRWPRRSSAIRAAARASGGTDAGSGAGRSSSCSRAASWPLAHAELRARLRPARAGDPGVHPCAADADGRGGAPCAGAARGAVVRRRDRHRPRRLLHAQAEGGRAARRELVEDGALVPVRSTGGPSRRTCCRTRAWSRPRRSHATLVSPFDSLIWDRKRTVAAVRVRLPHRGLRPAPRRRVRLLRAAGAGGRRASWAGST